jgi:hypothetical protein
MVSLVLSSLLVDGREIARGWYFFGDWDSSHNPLFVVGGLNPPPFISVRRFANDTIAWYYVEWRGSELAFPSTWDAIIPILLTVGVLTAGSALVLTIKKKLRF